MPKTWQTPCFSKASHTIFATQIGLKRVSLAHFPLGNHWLILMWDSCDTCSHRVFEFGRVLLRSPSSGRVIQSQLSSITSRQLSNISKDGESSTFLGDLSLSQGKCLLTFQRNLLCFSVCPSPLILDPSSSCPHFMCSYTLMRVPWALSSPRWIAWTLSAFP